MILAETPVAAIGPASRAAPNLESLDALRGVLAVYVLLGHVRWLLWDGHWQWTQNSHPWWADTLAYASAALRYGHEAVVCFFVLSGFFIHFRWAAAASGGGAPPAFNLHRYASRRLHRLFPPYALALLVPVLLDVAGRTWFPWLYGATTGITNIDQSFERMQYTGESVLTAALLLPSSSGVHFGTNGPLWSLAYEFVYYALYPLLLGARQRFGRSTFLVAGAASFAIALLIPNPFLSAVMLMYPLWLLGAAMSELMLSGAFKVPRSALIAMLAVGFVGFHWLRGVLAVFPYLVFGFAVVSLAARLPVSATGWRVHRFAHWLGVRSYTIYICHFPFVAFISAVVFETFGRRPLSGWIAATGALATLAWCCALWWLVERRFTHQKFSLPAAEVNG